VTDRTHSRRDLLKLGAAAAAVFMVDSNLRGAPFAVIPSTPTDKQSLSQHAAARGLLFGSAVKRSALDDKAYASLIAEQCNIIVPEGALKWDSLRPSRERFDFQNADWLREFATKHNLQFRGHTLVWHQALPAWFASEVNAKNAHDVLVEHIRTVVGRYAGQMHSWDVVNEIIDPADRRDDGLIKSPWLVYLGTDYVDLAFRTAAEADPKAMLVWNENLLEEDTGYGRAKRRSTLALLKALKKRGTPVHALGLQAHVHGEAAIAPELPEFLQSVADLGLKVLVTELDIRDGKLPAATTRRDQVVAQKYAELLAAVLPQKAVIAVLLWGLADRYSWMTSPKTEQRFKRADKLPCRPLPFDVDLKTKPAFVALERALDAAPPR
jgi:endo-1,4-beta-xylanase